MKPLRSDHEPLFGDLRLRYMWVPVLPLDNIDAARAAVEGLLRG